MVGLLVVAIVVVLLVGSVGSSLIALRAVVVIVILHCGEGAFVPMLWAAISVGNEGGLGLTVLLDLTELVTELVLIGSGLLGLEWRTLWRGELSWISLRGLLALISCGLGLHRVWVDSHLSGLYATLFEGFLLLMAVFSFGHASRFGLCEDLLNGSFQVGAEEAASADGADGRVSGASIRAESADWG